MRNRKKVLYVITKSVWGGAQRYVFDLATNLPQDQYEAVVACGGQGSLVTSLRQKNIKTLEIPAMARDVKILKEPKSLWQLFCLSLQEQPDIVHLNSSKAGGLGALAAFSFNILQIARRRPPAKIIFTVHGWVFRENRPLWQKPIIFFLSWVSTIFCHKIILINSGDFVLAKKFIIPSGKLALVRNGIAMANPTETLQAKNHLSAILKRQIISDTIYLGTLAELTPNKGLGYFIRAIAQIKSRDPKLKFVAVIIGEGEERKNLAMEIKTLGLGENVILAGFVENAERYLGGLDIFVLPSLKEGLPYALMEAMSVGLPVVATYVGGVPDLIVHSKNGLLVPPKNSDLMADAILQLARSPEYRTKLGGAAQTTIRNSFGIQNMLDQTFALYA